MSILLCFILLFACFCELAVWFSDSKNPYPYCGEYRELHTAAIYSIPDAVGYMHHGEGAYDPDIYIWEQDSYGRTRFAYCEDYDNQIFGLVIAQAYDDANVYFYPDKNYDLTLIESDVFYEGAADDHLMQKKVTDF